MKRFFQLLLLLTLLPSVCVTRAALPAPGQPPVIVSATSASGAVGIHFAYQTTATNKPTSFTAAYLPTGLTINAGTGLISGIPQAIGDSTCYVNAVNASGHDTLTLIINIKGVPPTVTSTGVATLTMYQNYSFQITATNNPSSFGAENLPPGLRVDTASGLISGSPVTAGQYTVGLSATNDLGTGTGTLVLTVVSILPTVTLQATVPRVTAGSDDVGEIVIQRTGGDLTQKLVVTYSIGGSARNGLDYVLLSGTKKIKPNRDSATIRIVPKGFGSGGLVRKVKLKLQPEDTTYQLGESIKAKVKIAPY